MRPEVVVPLFVKGGENVEVLQLGKGEERRCGDYVDSEGFRKAVLVDIEWVLQGKKPITVRVHSACVIDNINVFRWPTGCDVGDYNLL